MRAAIGVVALTVLLALAAPVTVHSQQPPTVAIQNFEFRPATLRVTIRSGETRQEIRWVNNGSVAHTVTADRGVFNSGQLAPGATFSVAFTAAGSFDYHCEIHSTMKGQIVVEVESSRDSEPGGDGY